MYYVVYRDSVSRGAAVLEIFECAWNSLSQHSLSIFSIQNLLEIISLQLYVRYVHV